MIGCEGGTCIISMGRQVLEKRADKLQNARYDKYYEATNQLNEHSKNGLVRELFDTKEVCWILNIKRTKLDDLRRAGQMKSVKVSGRRLYRRSDVYEYIGSMENSREVLYV